MKTYTELNEIFQEIPEYISTQEPVGIKEVPKITINCLEYDDECLNKYQFHLNNLSGYYEEYDTQKGVLITLATPIFAQLDYDALTMFHNFSLVSEVLARNTDNKDIKYYKNLGYFNNVSVKHKIYSDGEPTIWYITFSYKKHPYYKMNTVIEKDHKEIKQKIPKLLRSVKSETLGEVKL